ncbi:hypothetical protein [Arthrobacter sp. Rue61a]|uniref:hypothetical protein n=1 Tax=Arthrobacter sp. Rue61a TaxID=1118963 RepID=UPI0005BD4302|nr:hypothetical protein [Arthrobacter sp. Rue61a]
MKLPLGLAVPAFTEASDIHLLIMVGLVFLTGVAGAATVSLLLLLAPLATLFLGRNKPGRKTDVKQKKTDGGATRLPPPLTLGDEAA